MSRRITKQNVFYPKIYSCLHLYFPLFSVISVAISFFDFRLSNFQTSDSFPPFAFQLYDFPTFDFWLLLPFNFQLYDFQTFNFPTFAFQLLTLWLSDFRLFSTFRLYDFYICNTLNIPIYFVPIIFVIW